MARSWRAASWSVVALGAIVVLPCIASPQQPARTQLVLLGTGTPNADPERWGPAVAVVVDSVAYLVDAGPGVVRRAAAAARTGIRALAAPNLSRVFLTHLHSDHTVGLPDLIFSPWVLGREKPLEVYGPEGVRHMTDHIVEAYREDVYMRIYGLEPREPEGHKVRAYEVRPGLVYEDERVRVTAVPVHHGSWPYAYGYRFETPHRTIVISGDAAPSPALAEACSGCDILVHEVYSARRLREQTPEWQRYHNEYHTTTTELAKLAAQARPKLLVLYHLLPMGYPGEELEREIREAGFPGRVVAGKDLEVF